jgi:hypothetical protein
LRRSVAAARPQARSAEVMSTVARQRMRKPCADSMLAEAVFCTPSLAETCDS